MKTLRRFLGLVLVGAIGAAMLISVSDAGPTGGFHRGGPTGGVGYCSASNDGIVTAAQCSALNGAATLSSSYNIGTLAANQTMTLTDAHGGGVVINATSGAYTGTSAFKVDGSGTDFIVAADGTWSGGAATLDAVTAGDVTSTAQMTCTSTFNLFGQCVQRESDAATNTALDVYSALHLTSGTATTGFGTAFLLLAHDSIGQEENQARLRSRWTTATSGAETSAVDIQTRNAGSALATVATFAGNGAATFTGALSAGATTVTTAHATGAVTADSSLSVAGATKFGVTTLTLSNGTNNDVDINSSPGTLYVVTGPTGAFTITGFSAPTLGAGTFICVENGTAQNATFADEAGTGTTSAAANRLIHFNGADQATTGQGIFCYLYGNNPPALGLRWLLLAKLA
jgi:hypothetical protein